MRFIETMLVAVNQLAVNKLRSFLTLLGIIIGITAVITLTALGNGAIATISGQFEAIGTSMLFVQWDYGNEDEIPRNLMEKDIEEIRKGSDLVTNITPYNMANTEIKFGREHLYITVSGVGEGFLSVQGLKLASGRFFNAFEAATGKKLCVLGWDLHEKLFGKQDGIGKTIKLQGKQFKVIGVMEKKDDRSLVGTNITDNMRLYMPARTLRRIWNQKGYPVVLANPLEITLTKAAVGQIKGVLARLYGPKNNFLVQGMEELIEGEMNRLKIFSTFLAGLGGISLLVGGIGIMNIMLVSVKERTREIGIRKALGATKSDLLLQFLLEAILLCLAGGFLGLCLGLLFSYLIRIVTMIPATVTAGSILMAVACALAIGLFFGIYPAWKAAGLDPVESLRYE